MQALVGLLLAASIFTASACMADAKGTRPRTNDCTIIAKRICSLDPNYKAIPNPSSGPDDGGRVQLGEDHPRSFRMRGDSGKGSAAIDRFSSAISAASLSGAGSS
jgi:hypothetical protein